MGGLCGDGVQCVCEGVQCVCEGVCEGVAEVACMACAATPERMQGECACECACGCACGASADVRYA